MSTLDLVPNLTDAAASLPPKRRQLRHSSRSSSRVNRVEFQSFERAVTAAAQSNRPYFAWCDPCGATFVTVGSSTTFELDVQNRDETAVERWWCEPFDRETGLLSHCWSGFSRFSRSGTSRKEPAHDDEDWAAAGVQHAAARVIDSESPDSFKQRVRDARHACRDEVLDKVVLARAETVYAPAAQVFDVAESVAALRAGASRSIVFAVGDGSGASFVGATPEILARISDGTVTSHALAGTRPCTDRNAAEIGLELLGSDKDRREHEFVADWITSALMPLTTSLARQPRPTVLRVPGMCHLETSIQGRVRAGVGIREVAAALHPTPAVCGFPQARAKAWLAEHENLARGLYAGHVGWQRADGGGVAAVAIRSMLLRGDQATLFAGAGIVADSDPGEEWQETGWKLESARAALRLRQVDVA